MNVIFARNKKPISLLIRLVTWSRWSHCGIIVGDKVLEAVGGKGVVLTTLDKFKERYTEFDVCRMPTERGEFAAIDSAMMELGKAYDLSALFGIMFRTGWECPDSWFCSELIAHASGMFRADRVSRVTPEMIWSLCK
jgi:hypothetical protein